MKKAANQKLRLSTLAKQVEPTDAHLETDLPFSKV